MLGSEAYARWAPAESDWSNWVKPVMFTLELQGAASETRVTEPSQLPVDSLPPAVGDTCLVIDLDGPTSVAVGLMLAQRGYRPVPLFNGVNGPAPLVPVAELARALIDAVSALESIALPANAAPAFLLDARRLSGIPAPRVFDNRWVVLPEDFPSANKLLAAGIRRCVLVTEHVQQRDLPHVLLRYKQSGIELLALNTAGRLIPHTPVRPSWFGSLVARVSVLAGLRRSSAGGFGALVPEVNRGGSG
jgi:hypothetical protein